LTPEFIMNAIDAGFTTEQLARAEQAMAGSFTLSSRLSTSNTWRLPRHGITPDFGSSQWSELADEA
jgi:hypothetical protein